MGEPLSAAAGVVGIVVPAMHGARLLLNDVEKIHGAFETVEVLKRELNELVLATEGLKAVEPSELKSLGVAEQSLSAIKTCDEACETFREKLQRWTKHSEDGKKSLRDRLQVGFFKDKKIQSLSTQLQTCRTTLISAVTNATLHSSIRQSGITTEIRKQITTSEFQLAAAIKVNDEQSIEVERRFKDVSLKDAGQESDEAEDKSEALNQIEEERKALSESRKLLETLLTKTKERSGINVTNIRLSTDGQVVAGLINAGGKYADARIVVNDVQATSGGQGIAGIVEGYDLKDFFKKGRYEKPHP